MESIQAVIQSLNELNEIHQQLIQIEHLKTEAITRNETNDLVKQLGQQTELVKKVSALEQERQLNVKRWLIENNVDHDDMSLSDLIKLTPNLQDKQELNRLGEQLQSRVNELRALNKLNEQLIEQSLSYIELTIRLATHNLNDHLTYGRNTELTKAASPQRGFFDSKA